MKKTVFSIIFAMAFAMVLGSCGQSTSAAADTDSTAVDSVDTTVVDSTLADSTVIDSTAVCCD